MAAHAPAAILRGSPLCGERLRMTAIHCAAIAARVVAGLDPATHLLK
jgi:hypothetical protein